MNLAKQAYNTYEQSQDKDQGDDNNDRSSGQQPGGKGRKQEADNDNDGQHSHKGGNQDTGYGSFPRPENTNMKMVTEAEHNQEEVLHTEISLKRRILRLNMLVILVIRVCFLALFNTPKSKLIKVALMRKMLWMRINRFIIKANPVVALILGLLVLPQHCKLLNPCLVVVDWVKRPPRFSVLY